MSWKDNVKNWDGKLYKALRSNKSCHGGNFEWSLPSDGKPGDWTPIIENVEMCVRGYHLTTHYAHWSDTEGISVYEAEGDVAKFDGYDKVVCSRARLLNKIENPFNENNIGKNNSGDYNSGDYNSGCNNIGNKNSGNWNYGDLNSGNWNYGYCNSGNYNFGNRNSGNYNYGNKNSGDYNLGNYNSGNWNSGNWNFGNLNSGDSGYFYSDYGFDKIFNKPTPKDWEPKYPKWIYFKLLPGGYYTSWQKAFEGADINGIKKLLALPNFDYEIFEEITSITRKQIEDKLGGL